MNRMLEIRERVAKYGLSRIAKDEVAWWNARDELNFNAYDDLQDLLQDHTRLTAEIESLTAERDRFKALIDAAERDIQNMLRSQETAGFCIYCLNLCSDGCECSTDAEWRGPQEGANT